nr:EOG090X0N9E [Lepidurus arcticus]
MLLADCANAVSTTFHETRLKTNMDSTVILSFAAGTLSVIILLLVYLKKNLITSEVAGNIQANQDAPEQVHVARRVAGGRGLRARGVQAEARPVAVQQEEDRNSEDEALDWLEIELPDGKVGKKKLAKLEAKAEKKAMREAEEREREERKAKQAKLDEERRKKDEEEKAEELRQEEAEKKAREEKEKKDLEAYLALKAAFTVEEEGFDEADAEDTEANSLQQFIQFIQDSKIVLLEDLAARFRMKTQDTIDRLQQLVAEGRLTGVIDDRGKFIYICQAELEAVARFVKQRGRVSLSDLAESSNKLINLVPEKQTLSAA